ncbi:MAG: hypothetical protein WA901_20490 [Phormidesmis sp.]
MLSFLAPLLNQLIRDGISQRNRFPKRCSSSTKRGLLLMPDIIFSSSLIQNQYNLILTCQNVLGQLY